MQGVDIQVLIDGGSSDNFLQPRIAKFLNLPIELAFMFRVTVGNGHYMTAEGLVKNVKVPMQGHSIKVPVYLLPMSGADLILRAAWLATLQWHLANYDSLQIRFFHQGKFITLRGEASLSPAAAQFNHIRRFHATHSIVEAYTIEPIDMTHHSEPLLELPKNVEPELALLLH